MDDGISMFLTVVSEVKSEFMLERFGNSPKSCDFMRKHSESITVYKKIVFKFDFSNHTTTNR